MQIHHRLFALSALTLALAACSTPATKPDAETEGRIFGTEQAQPEEAGAEATPYGAEGEMSVAFLLNDPQSPLNDPQNPLAERVIYFEYDSSNVADEYLDLVAEHGKFLAANPNLKVRLEGHADERGSREYNVGLGDRRAQSVRKLLMFQGVSPDQVATVSYGEEKPLVLGHSDDAWSKNRRVEITYEER